LIFSFEWIALYSSIIDNILLSFFFTSFLEYFLYRECLKVCSERTNCNFELKIYCCILL